MATLWTPAEITTALWLDASDSGTITLDGSNNVEQWDDKSGNVYEFTQATAGLRPAYNTTQNALGTIDFSEDFLQSTAAASTWKWLHDATTKYSVFTVCKPKNTYFGNVWATNHGGNVSIGCHLRREGSSSTLAASAVSCRVTRGSSGYRVLKYTNANTLENGNWGIITLNTDIANATVADRAFIYIDGDDAGDNNFSDDDLSASTADPTETLRIGDNSEASLPFVGEIAELVFCDYDLSISTRQKIEGYLAHKWGLEGNLPVDHPYKASAPESDDPDLTDGIALGDSVEIDSNARRMTDGAGLGDAVDVQVEYGAAIEDSFGAGDTPGRTQEMAEAVSAGAALGDTAEAENWTEWLRSNDHKTTKRFYLTLTGSADGETDLELPISSFQCRRRSGEPTFLECFVPAVTEYADDIAVRTNGQLVLEMAYVLSGVEVLREEIARVDLEYIDANRGGRSQTTGLSGHRTETYSPQSAYLSGAIYVGQSYGLRRVRTAMPDVYLRPGDTVTVDSDSWTVDVVTYWCNRDQQVMEVAEA